VNTWLNQEKEFCAMIAEIENKISPTGSNLSDRLEDKLTGDVFGSLSYLPKKKEITPAGTDERICFIVYSKTEYLAADRGGDGGGSREVDFFNSCEGYNSWENSRSLCQFDNFRFLSPKIYLMVYINC
jgi:hypothetical protein